MDRIKLVFATNNPNKLDELRAAVPSSIQVISLAEAGMETSIPEDFDTLEENSRQKATFIVDRTGLNVFADDTGLEVDALDGRPGVFSARYAGEGCSSADNVQLVLEQLNGNAERAARFRTVITLIWAGREYQFEGRCEGAITEEVTGNGGFGYDPIFRPEGFEQTFAEMPLPEKNKISHRGRAVQKLIDFLHEQA